MELGHHRRIVDEETRLATAGRDGLQGRHTLQMREPIKLPSRSGLDVESRGTGTSPPRADKLLIRPPTDTRGRQAETFKSPRSSAEQRQDGATGVALRLIVREDLAVLDVGQRIGDFVGVDGGNELEQPTRECRDVSAAEERPQGVGIGEAEDQ